MKTIMLSLSNLFNFLSILVSCMYVWMCPEKFWICVLLANEDHSLIFIKPANFQKTRRKIPTNTQTDSTLHSYILQTPFQQWLVLKSIFSRWGIHAQLLQKLQTFTDAQERNSGLNMDINILNRMARIHCLKIFFFFFFIYCPSEEIYLHIFQRTKKVLTPIILL